MAKLKCSTSFLRIFSTFSSNFLQTFQMTKLNCFHHHRSTDVCKNTGIGKTFYSKECFLCKNSSTGCTTSASTDPVPVVAISLKHLIWHLVCVCVCVCQDEFLSHISSCALSQSINWQKCHNKTGSFECTPSIHAKTAGETVRRSHLLVLRQGLKRFHSKRAANWNRKKWKAWSKKVALQDPASTAAKSHSNLTFSVWTWVQYTWSKKALTWLYIEDITSKHRVPAEPLHPACSMRRPAKRRVLTTQRARTAEYDFGGECHPDLQRLGNTETEKGLASCWR